MAIALLDFREPYLEQVMACGIISAANAADVDWLSGTVRRFASYKGSNGTEAFAALIIEREEGSHANSGPIHFHLDCMKASYFPDGPPEIEGTVEEILEFAGRFRGKPVFTKLDSRFVVPRTKLGRTSIVRPLLTFSTRAGGTTVALTGGRMDLEDSPCLIRVNWKQEQRDDIDVIVADIEGVSDLIVTEQILESILTLLRPAFESVVIGRRKNVAPSHSEQE